MVSKDQILKLCVPLETKEVGEDDDELIISGHASTNDEDRSGDVIVTDAWKKPEALKDYLKNPIVLAFHDMSRPIGKTIGHEVDDKGLKITAQISKAAGDIRQLIKEGILAAFSVGFMIKDADFNADNGLFVIKEVELYEVSVVSIPANQNALFSIEKNFSNPDEFKEFKKQFIKESEETLMVDKAKDDKVEQKPVDIASLAKEISAMVKSDLVAEQKAAEEAKKAEEERQAQIAATATTAAEKLIKDLREELVNKDKDLTEALTGLHSVVKELSSEGELQKAFSAENKGKMEYAAADDSRWKELDRFTRHGLIYASHIKGVDIEELNTFKDFVKKSGMEHWDSTVAVEWEEEYSTTIQNAMREQLVVEPLFTSIPMSTPTMTMPINPEAGDATWIHEGAYRSDTAPWAETGDGSTTSTGVAVNHQLLDQTMIARKLATREYIGYEEEEDSIVALAPVINDAVARRMAKTSDLALLRGGGVLSAGAYDPITGLENRGALTTDVVVPGAAAWASDSSWSEDLFVDMRRNLGLYGLDASSLVLLASHDLYYELMKLPNFKTIDVLGDKATIITGQVGALFGVRVLVSQQFDNTAITQGDHDTTLGIMVRPSNFIMGNLRGILTEADKDIINQKRAIVSSRRFAFNDIISGAATVNLSIGS